MQDKIPQLEKKILIKGTIIVQTGLMIGGSSSSLDIGGIDKYVVRHPITKLPYIPGSSLKGKMRSLLELRYGHLELKRDRDLHIIGAKSSQNPEHSTARMFGHIKSQEKHVLNPTQQPSRIIVRDSELINAKHLEDTELLYTEVKAENTIDRITSEANPRFFERVPKGARFELNIVLNYFTTDKDDFLARTLEAFRLIQDDYLGGGGSRGNGQVRFELKSIKERAAAYYSLEGEEEEALEIPEEFKKK